MLATEQREILIGHIKKHNQPWPLVIIGGGIVGAGILQLASQLGIDALLVEKKDFAWGSSSRSSKLVHGGLRYIQHGEIGLTRESVRERERLLREAPGLVEPLSIVLSHHKNKFPGPYLFQLLLRIYNFFAGHKLRKLWAKTDYKLLTPGVEEADLTGGSQFADAVTDDARLVLRLIQEAQLRGAHAINYMAVKRLITADELVCGVVIADEQGNEMAIPAKVVVSATGPWTDQIREQVGAAKTMRAQRGSHLFIPSWRLPVASSVTIMHPRDGRPVYIMPWESSTLVGTTDVDQASLSDQEPGITREEFDYLLEAVTAEFPHTEITEKDVISTSAGIRPIVSSRKHDLDKPIPTSSEKRNHLIWQDRDLISVAGGKLTTFRQIAEDVMNIVTRRLGMRQVDTDKPAYESPKDTAKDPRMPSWVLKRLQGIYGAETVTFLKTSEDEWLTPIGSTRVLWAELVWAARFEQVEHLDDLLLRRTRLGNLLPEGGRAWLNEIKDLCRPELGWDENRWNAECKRYLAIWHEAYGIPPKVNG